MGLCFTGPLVPIEYSILSGKGSRYTYNAVQFPGTNKRDLELLLQPTMSETISIMPKVISEQHVTGAKDAALRKLFHFIDPDTKAGTPCSKIPREMRR